MFLALLLSFGWPTPKVEVVHNLGPHPALNLIVLSKCCGSMEPLIHGGELAYIEYYHGQPLEEGLVIAANGRLHMIVAMMGETIWTVGINNERTDRKSKKKDVKFILRILVKP